MEESNKNIDESWKEKIEREKDALKEEKDFIPPEANFNFFISTLSLQASIALGLIPNPITDKKEENLKQAKFIIDTLGMLKEKTEGNLTEEETGLLEDSLYELRMQYIAKTEKGETQ